MYNKVSEYTYSQPMSTRFHVILIDFDSASSIGGTTFKKFHTAYGWISRMKRASKSYVCSGAYYVELVEAGASRPISM